MDVVECISPPMCGSHSWVIHTDSLVDIIHWRRTLCLWDPFSDMWQCLWHPEPFHAFRIHCFAKPLNRWLTLIDFAGWFCPTCVRGTWVTSWIDVILIWYNYIVICTLVTILNWWLSSKDIKLRVLIKEVLVVFHWLTFCIILLCSLESGHRALFLIQEATQELLYLCKYIYTFHNLFLNLLRHGDGRTFFPWQSHNETSRHPITRPCLSNSVY